MSKIEWRFPGNNYTAESGLDTSDMETFKKDPISSLARELCQNSIDARKDDTKPVFIDFNLFSIKNQEIPGKDRIYQEIKSCSSEWASNRKIAEQLKEMEKAINKEDISCLRVSDFNTKGLVGVSSNEKKAWYLLTKGSGISDKVGTTGGSKGIGKFATFVASEFNTVFYSTETIEGEIGYQGICKLCSTSIEGTDEKTQGIGYFGHDEKNAPILKAFSLDSNYKRKESGTDIYIVGFRQETSWIKDIITKVLDSFMSAIIREQLVVKVQDIILSKDNLNEIINNSDYILKNSQKDIIAQYDLLVGTDVYRETITLDEYGTAELFVKGYEKNEINQASNNCVMIRYPYMKIKIKKGFSAIPFSAMCIIGDNKLNSILRDIENPQHTEWEHKRIHDSSKRAEVVGLMRKLDRQISEIIINFLSSGSSQETDIEGASDYLPESGDYDLGDNQTVIVDKPKIVQPKKNIIVEKTGYEETEDGLALQPEIGAFVEGDESPIPSGENQGGGGEPRDHEKTAGIGDGDSDMLKYVSLTGIKYRFLVIDKSIGLYSIIFTSPFDEKDCDLKIYYVDEGGNKYPVQITKALLNHAACELVDEYTIKFELFENKKYSFELYTDQEDLFACEVKIHARR
jgi:hypothetical protein